MTPFWSGSGRWLTTARPIAGTDWTLLVAVDQADALAAGIRAGFLCGAIISVLMVLAAFLSSA